MYWVWPLIWLAVAIIAAVAEGMTVQLVSIWFAISAAVTALVALFARPDFSMQLMLFSLLGLILLLATRPFIRGKMQVKKERTNADMVVGKTGVVIKTVGDSTDAGRVQVTGLDWAAKTPDGVHVNPGERVTVLAIEGATLVVEQEKTKSAAKAE